jgi:hypothetical protein
MKLRIPPLGNSVILNLPHTKSKRNLWNACLLLVLPFISQCKVALENQLNTEPSTSESNRNQALQAVDSNPVFLSPKESDLVLENLKILSSNSSHPREVVRFLSDRFQTNYLIKYKSNCESIQSNDNRLILDFFANSGNLNISFQTNSAENDWLVLALKRESNSQFTGLQISKNSKTLSHRNTCSGCHGAENRPLYFPHPVWPGTLGSIAVNSLVDAPNSEKAIFKKFLGNQQNEGSVYKPLKNISRYYEREVNKQFVESMDKVLIESMFQKMEQDPRYPHLKFALLGAAIGCSKIDDFLPNQFRKYFPTRIEYYFTQTKELITKNHASTLYYQKTWLPSSPQDLSVENLAPFLSDSYIRTISNLRFLLEGKHKDFAEWFPHPIPNSFTFGFTSAIAGTLPTLLRKNTIKGNESVQCETLQKNSIHALNQLKTSEAEKLFSSFDQLEKPINVTTNPSDFLSYKSLRAFDSVHNA